MREISLEIKGLNKVFGTKNVVDNLSLKIKKGEIYALIGPNGAGKTTTIKMITGLIIPTSGEIYLNGERNLDSSRKIMAYIPDEPFVYPYLSGGEFLDYVGSIYGLEKKEIRKRTKLMIETFKIKNEVNELFESYSRGTKQKLMIIAAMMKRPEVLIVDEPIVGLDVEAQKNVTKMFKDFTQKGGSILLCTHTLSVAQEIADTVGFIKEGKLIEEIKPPINNLEEKYLKIIND